MVVGIGIADTVRDMALEALAILCSAGSKRIVMLTGDNQTVAALVGAMLAIMPTGLYAYCLGLGSV